MISILCHFFYHGISAEVKKE